MFLYAFDLIELNGDDLRRDPPEVRKATLASVLTKAGPGIRFNEQWRAMARPSSPHACKMGLEGHRLEAEGFRLPFRPVAALGQDETRDVRP